MEGKMRSAGVRSGVAAVLCVVAVAGLSACATTRARTTEAAYHLTGTEPTGTVVRVDEPQQVIVLDNGKMYRVYGDNAVYVDGRPVAYRTVRPGSRVTIVNGTPVVFQNGQYVVMDTSGPSGAVAPGGVLTSQPPAAVVTAPSTTVVTAPPATPGTVTVPPPAVVTAPPVVAAAPAGTVIAPAPGTFRLTGRVVDVDRNEVKVRLDNGKAFEFRPPAGMIFRKGDPVTIDMSVAGSPSALPR
jgi:hypothetical protein